MQGFHTKSFVQGLVVGVLVVATLGGVYLLGTRNSGGIKLAQNNNALAPTAPTAADDANSPFGPVSGTVKAASKDDHIVGSLNAKVVLIEYSDIECPYCKRFHTAMQEVVKNYGNKVAWIYRHYPLSFHANAQKEAEATECAASLGGNDAFWKYTNALYERTTSNGTGFALTDLAPLAKELGLDQAKFKSCLDSGKFSEKVKQDLSEGMAAGIQGTPGTIIVVDGKVKEKMNGALPFDVIKTELDTLL